MEFKDLIGKVLDFYGVDNNQFKINDYVFEAIEDEDDGWRSYLDSIEIKESDGIFFKNPLGKIMINEIDDGYFEGYEFKDDDGHIWLEVGTENYQDWYPCFVFRYNPKEEK